MAKTKTNLNHVAIIMDGNGRWATSQNKPRIFGHKHGIETIGKVVSFAIDSKVKFLTLFAFSCENWNRPKNEVSFLIKSFINKISSSKTAKELIKNKVRFKWLGFEDKLPKKLIDSIKTLEKKTSGLNGLTLTIAFNYGGAQDLMQAANKKNKLSLKQNMYSSFLPNVDLLIRTGNETRISNFLIFECSYAEIIFEPTFWPAYQKKHWTKNINSFYKKERRFGKIN